MRGVATSLVMLSALSRCCCMSEQNDCQQPWNQPTRALSFCGLANDAPKSLIQDQGFTERVHPTPQSGVRMKAVQACRRSDLPPSACGNQCSDICFSRVYYMDGRDKRGRG